MEITFLGTSSGLTETNRFYTNLFIKESDYELLIDCGDGISKQLVNYNLKESINSIIITHFHADHLAGLPSLLTQMKLLKRTKPLCLYVYYSLTKVMEYMLNTFLLFPNKFSFPFTVIPIKQNKKVTLDCNISFIAKRNTHVKDKEYYIFNKKINPVSTSLQITNNKSSLIYTSDIGNSEDLYLYNIKKNKYFISEISHVEIFDILQLLKTNLTITVILTHYDINKLHKLLDNNEINSFINSKRLIIAEDNYNISI